MDPNEKLSQWNAIIYVNFLDWQPANCTVMIVYIVSQIYKLFINHIFSNFGSKLQTRFCKIIFWKEIPKYRFM